MALTPIVFFELATPGRAVPCPDPYFLAVKLTKGLVERLQAVARLCHEHKLASVMVDGEGLPIEFMDTLLLEPSTRLHVVGNQLLISVWGRRNEDGGGANKLEHVADTWLIDIPGVVHLYEVGVPVTLRAWEEWDDPDVDQAPFGERVYETLGALNLLPGYRRMEWFYPSVVALIDGLDKPAVERSARPSRSRV